VRLNVRQNIPLAASLWRARWDAMNGPARGAALVSMGSLTLVVMGMVVKFLGARIPTIEILFFRSAVGFCFVLPVFMRDPLAPLRTTRPGMHFVRGTVGAFGNTLFFWTLTHMLLADAMALQFSRPLFMIPLAIAMLGEIVGVRRSIATVVGFLGIVVYARPFTAGFDPNVFVGAAGALVGALVVICIKRLSTTEPTPVIMFYYAFWTAVLTSLPTAWLWVTPTGADLLLLVTVGFLGIFGQWMITHGWTLGDATALAPLDSSRIVYSSLLGYLVFGELPGPWSLVGMVLIVASSLYLVLSEARRARRVLADRPSS
jgi:drug/metabolite transporter (DMT)-like permease